MKASVKVFAGIALAFCLGGFCGLTATDAYAEEQSFTQTLETKVVGVNNENLDNGNCFVMVLLETDYMTAADWNTTDYKWKNAEEVLSFEDRKKIDAENCNVCNATLDQNLSEYNFEEYIFVDGQPLSTYAKTYPYKLIANKRTRVNTLSLDFAEGVLDTISSIEIKAGCQLPTMSYSYFGTGEASCLLVDEDVAFKQYRGRWTNFLGYEEGVEYEASDKMLDLSLDKTYKTHNTTPLDGFTDFFNGRNIAGEYYYGMALASSADTQKGYLMRLRFIVPIDAALFDIISLRVYTNVERTLSVYNANNVTEQSKGEALQNFSIKGGGTYSYIDLISALYVDEDNTVSEIIFEFGEDGAPQKDVFGDVMKDEYGNVIREQFFFISYHVSKNRIVTKESFVIAEDEDAYEIAFRFNKSGAFDEGVALDTSKVFLNGCSLAQVLLECAEGSATWHSVMSVYQINIRLPKSYTGAGQIKNAAGNYVGNSMTVQKGLVFPNGDTLSKTYTCRLYTGEKLVDCELVNEYKATEVIGVELSFVEESENIHFTLYFDKDVTSLPYYHACEMETWRSTELKAVSETLYDEAISEIFVVGGYKSSLLDRISINGKTIGEWHAHDSKQPTNVQVHYGNTALNCVDIFFAKACPNTYDALYDLVTSGNGITIEVESGLKFMVNTQTKKAQTFVFERGEFIQQIEEKPIQVYFNGSEVFEGDKITVDGAVSKSSISVEGVTEYQITDKVNGAERIYTVTYGGSNTFTFAVVTNIQEESKEEKGGCSSSVGYNAVWSALTLAGGALFMRRGKKNEEN